MGFGNTRENGLSTRLQPKLPPLLECWLARCTFWRPSQLPLNPFHWFFSLPSHLWWPHQSTLQFDLCNILQGASVTLHIIFLGVGGTIYNIHTLKPFKELGLDFRRVKKLASKLHVHSVNFAAKLVHTNVPFPGFMHDQISPGAGFRPSLQPSWSPLIFPSFSRWRIFTILGTKVAPFP